MKSPTDKLLATATDFELWQVVATSPSKSKRPTEVQRIAWAVWVASGMIGNRGFFNHTAEEMADWASAYDTLGITAAAVAIRDAARIMPSIKWSSNDPTEQLLDDPECRYYAADKSTRRAIAALIRQHPTEAFAGLVITKSNGFSG